MATPNFSTILDEAPTEVAPYRILPQGTYLWTIIDGPRYGRNEKTGNEFVEFPCRPIQPLDDVDLEEVEAAGGVEGKLVRKTLWITEDAIRMLDQFHEHCGIDLSEPASRRARNDDMMNRQFIGYLKHNPSRKEGDDRVFMEITRTASAE
jgi:hypothetical protein